MLSDELYVLHLMAARLDQAGIRFMLSGSTALGAYATPRMTRDIDMVVEIGPADVDRFVGLFAADFYCDADAVQRAVATRGIVNLIHLERVVKVDVIVRKDSDYHRVEFQRQRRVRLGDADIPVVSPEDLILSKLAWTRERRSEVQFRDVRDLIASVPDLDWVYLEHWAGVLDLQASLTEMRG